MIFVKQDLDVFQVVSKEDKQILDHLLHVFIRMN